jgi:PiT family inorganic phosphate transporter
VFVGTYTDPRAEKLFSYIEIFSASLFSFARGSNDASHGTGPFALGMAIYLDGKDALTGDTRDVDVWVMAIGGVCMALGLILLGKKVVKTVGDSLTEITPSSGVMTELATAIIVLGFSALALPISSTHTMVGTIYGMSKFRKHVIERWFVEPEGKETKEMVEPKRTGKTRREDVDNSEEENSDSSKSKGSNSQRIINEEPADNGNEEQGPPVTGFRGFMKRHKTSIKIFSAWVITIPLSGAIAAMFYAMFDA